MVITTDFNIFADKYHNKQHLPDDIIDMIMNINTQEIKAQKNYKNVIDTINQIKYYDDDGDMSINEITNNDEAIRQNRWLDLEYVFIEVLYTRIFGVLIELNRDNRHNRHKITRKAYERSEAFYEYFWTNYHRVEHNHRGEIYFVDYKRLYPENLVRDQH